MSKRNFLVDIDLNKNQVLNLVFQNLSTAPASPSLGQVYYDTVSNNLNLWDGSWTDLTSQGSGSTNLSYSATSTNGTVISSNGTNATLLLATGANAGLLSPSQFTLLGNTSGSNTGDNAVNSLYSGLVSNVSTSLSTGTVNATTYGITSDGGVNDIILVEATTTNAGLLGATKFNNIVTNNAKVSNVSTSLSTGTVNATTYGITSDGSVDDIVLLEATTTNAGLLSATKFNNIVTNNAKVSATASNVNAAGATMNSDTTLAGNGYFLNDGTFSANDGTKAASQQSIKTYVDTKVTSAKSYIGGYNASTNTPDLDSLPSSGISKGDQYTVTVSGTFFTTLVEIGDVLISEKDSPTLESDWTIVHGNLDAASIKAQYESNSNTNALTDANLTLLGNTSGVNTGDEVSSTTTTPGVIELATQTEVNNGTDAVRAVTPATLKSNLGITATLSVAKKYASAIGDGVSTSIAVTHGIGTKDVNAQIYRVASPFDVVECEINKTSTTVTTFNFNVAPTSGEFRCVIIG